MRRELAAWIDQGLSHALSGPIRRFVPRQAPMLGAPIDSGFNRLAWLLPYLAGVTGVLGVGLVAVRWWHQRPAEAPDTTPADPDLEERIDDELRDFD
jgi:hypothetical protein